jgi:hypothetical protein
VEGWKWRSGNFRGWCQLRKLLNNECAPEPRWSYEHPGYTLDEVWHDLHQKEKADV